MYLSNNKLVYIHRKNVQTHKKGEYRMRRYSFYCNLHLSCNLLSFAFMDVAIIVFFHPGNMDMLQQIKSK